MDKANIIKLAKGAEEEKIGFSLKLPKSLKDQLQEVSEEENVSMNALIVAALQSMFSDAGGEQLKLARNLLLDYRKMIEPKVAHYEMYEPSSIEEEMEANHILSTYSQINKLLGV